MNMSITNGGGTKLKISFFVCFTDETIPHFTDSVHNFKGKNKKNLRDQIKEKQQKSDDIMDSNSQFNDSRNPTFQQEEEIKELDIDRVESSSHYLPFKRHKSSSQPNLEPLQVTKDSRDSLLVQGQFESIEEREEESSESEVNQKTPAKVHQDAEEYVVEDIFQRALLGAYIHPITKIIEEEIKEKQHSQRIHRFQDSEISRIKPPQIQLGEIKLRIPESPFFKKPVLANVQTNQLLIGVEEKSVDSSLERDNEVDEIFETKSDQQYTGQHEEDCSLDLLDDTVCTKMKIEEMQSHTLKKVTQKYRDKDTFVKKEELPEKVLTTVLQSENDPSPGHTHLANNNTVEISIKKQLTLAVPEKNQNDTESISLAEDNE